jgi:LysR family glycine cleavage system transcriptional activator
MKETRLPPIQLLAAFEAAGRSGSFKQAARELHVTPSAISQQLRALEDALGFALFERQARAVTLTEAGGLYLEVARETLDVFRRGSVRVLERYRRHVLRLNADPSVAHEILIPALSSFERAHRDIDLRLETSNALIDLRVDAADAALRYGRGPWPGVVSLPVAEMVSTPVASPGLLEQKPLRSVSDLSQHTLLRVQGTPDYWRQFATQAGFGIRRQRGFDSYQATLQAAAHGIGIALGLFPVSTAWVRDRRLIAPLPLRLNAAGYQLVCRPGDERRTDLVKLLAWLGRCFAALPALD